MVSIEPFLSAGPVDERHENDHRNRPVAQRPVDQSSEVSGKPPCEFPDKVHVATLREKQFARDLGVAMIIAKAGTETQ